MTRYKIRPPIVFISYSHDSPEHADRVLALSDHLRSDGIDCVLDQYEDSPPEGFPRWMDHQISAADFVLMICTPTYYRRVMGEEEPDRGHGVMWESALIYQYIYNAGTSNKRFIPVLLEKAHESDIPVPWQGVKYYRPTTKYGYEELYRRLTGQPLTTKPALGTLRMLPPRERKQDFIDDTPQKRQLEVTEKIAPYIPPPPSPRNSGNRVGFIVGIILLVLLLIGGGVLVWNKYSASLNAASVAATTAQAHATATASAVAALLQCPSGTLQSPTAIQTQAVVVPDGSALVVTLPTADDAQTVILLANNISLKENSDLHKFVCTHDLARIGATHQGPEILVLHEEGRSSVDLILYQGSPIINVVPNTQTDSEISNFNQSYANVCHYQEIYNGHVCVYHDINHKQSTPDQPNGNIP